MGKRSPHASVLWGHLTAEWQNKTDIIAASGVPNTAFKRAIARWIAIGAVERRLSHSGINHLGEYRLLIPKEQGPPKIPRRRISTAGSPAREGTDTQQIYESAKLHALRFQETIERLASDKQKVEAQLIAAKQSLEKWEAVADAMAALIGKEA